MVQTIPGASGLGAGKLNDVVNDGWLNIQTMLARFCGYGLMQGRQHCARLVLISASYSVMCQTKVNDAS